MNINLQHAAARLRTIFQHTTSHATTPSLPHRVPRFLITSSTRLQARSWYTASPFRIRHNERLFRLPRTSRRNASDRPSPDVTAQLGSPEPKLGLQGRLKKLFKQYGYLSVGVYLALSIADFPFCFLAVRLAGPERIGQIEHQILSRIKAFTAPVWSMIEPVVGPTVYTISETVSRIRKGAANTAGVDISDATTPLDNPPKKAEAASIWTQLVLAYGIHKTLLIFVRVPLTAVLTPKVARLFQSWGWRIGRKPTT